MNYLIITIVLVVMVLGVIVAMRKKPNDNKTTPLSIDEIQRELEGLEASGDGFVIFLATVPNDFAYVQTRLGDEKGKLEVEAVSSKNSKKVTNTHEAALKLLGWDESSQSKKYGDNFRKLLPVDSIQNKDAATLIFKSLCAYGLLEGSPMKIDRDY